MARNLTKDQAAEADLVAIWVNSFETWGEPQADPYVNALEKGTRRLVDRPTNGTPRDELHQGFWSQRIEHHVVFYTFPDAELRVRRVLHAVGDVGQHL